MTVDRAQLLRRLGVAAAATSFPAGASEALAARTAGPYPAHPRWQFVFVSHQTTSPLYVPTQYGIADACALVNCMYEWAGSAEEDVEEMARAVDAAVALRASGIGVSVLEGRSLDGAIARALQAGIPVVAFAVPGVLRATRLPFVGQDPYTAGVRTGERLAALGRGGEVALFSPPSSSARRRAAGISAGVRRTGAAPPRTVALQGDALDQAAQIEQYALERRRVQVLVATDLVTTDGVGRAMRKHRLREKGMRAVGYGVLPATLKLIDEEALDFTVDEEPYLQGFLPALQLFLARISGGLVPPVDVNTGVRFVTKANVKTYLRAKTRFEGSSSKHRYPIGS